MWKLGSGRDYLKGTGGNVVLTFSLVLPVLLALAGLAMDTASFYDQQTRMQNVADSSALAIAKEMHLFLTDPESLKAAGEAKTEAMLTDVGLGGRSHAVDVDLDTVQGRAKVTITMATKSFLPAGVWGDGPVEVSADAHTFGDVKLCVLGLHGTGPAISADHAALITAPECALQSNSVDADAMRAANLSTLVSVYICSSGGYDGLVTSFLPLPETDCPAVEDPLQSRSPPAVGGCDYLDVKLSTGENSIAPGTYCGGLQLTGHADVTAEPGTYIITRGKLWVGNNASLHGDDVSFYFADEDAVIDFADEDAVIDFTDKADIALAAPKEGPMAGLLFYENPKAPEGRDFEISSDSARKLLGTIYLPKGTFKGGGTGKIGDLSAYTVIVANRIELDGAQLIINADYSSSGVPVPSGLGPNSSKVRLAN